MTFVIYLAGFWFGGAFLTAIVLSKVFAIAGDLLAEVTPLPEHKAQALARAALFVVAWPYFLARLTALEVDREKVREGFEASMRAQFSGRRFEPIPPPQPIVTLDHGELAETSERWWEARERWMTEHPPPAPCDDCMARVKQWNADSQAWLVENPPPLGERPVLLEPRA